MIIFMEGADRVGKTNIGQALAENLRIPYFRMGSQHDNWRKGKFKEALEFDQSYLLEFVKQTGCSAIIDRAWPSEWVYSRVYGRETNQELLESLDKQWAELGAWIVIPMRYSFEKADDDEVVGKETLPLIQEVYSGFAAWSRCNVMSFFVDGQNVNCNINKELQLILPIFRMMGREQNVLNQYVHPPHGLGRIRIHFEERKE